MIARDSQCAWSATAGKRKKAARRASWVALPLLWLGLFLVAAGCSGDKKGGDKEKGGEDDKKTPPTSSAALDLVPADATAFATVALARWWNGEHGKRLQQHLAQLDAAAEMEKIFGVPPDQAERITLVVVGNEEPCPIVTSMGAYDQKKILAKLAPGAEEYRVGGRSVYRQRGRGVGVCFLDSRSYVLGNQASVQKFLELLAKGGDKGPFQPALALADKHLLVVGLNPRSKELEELRRLKDDPKLKPLSPLLEATSGWLTLDLTEELRLDAVLTYPDAAKAEKGLTGVKADILLAQAGLAALRKEVPGLQPTFSFAEALLRTATTEQKEANVRVAVQSEKGSVEQFAAALAPPIQKAREAAARVQSANNLRQIGLAFHNYHDQHKRFPPPAIYGKDGNPLLSWRVAILPFVGEEGEKLYEQFKLDEPWDSEHNKKLLAKIPAVFAPPRGKAAGPGETFYQGFIGNSAFFEVKMGNTVADIPDGLSRTMMIAEAARAVPWTKPEDIPFDPSQPVPQLGGLFKEGFNALFADGHVTFFSRDVKPDDLKPLITRNARDRIRIRDY